MRNFELSELRVPMFWELQVCMLILDFFSEHPTVTLMHHFPKWGSMVHCGLVVNKN